MGKLLVVPLLYFTLPAIASVAIAPVTASATARISSEKPAEKATYPVQKISIKGITDIKIIGVKGHLKMRGVKNARSLSLYVKHSEGRRFDDWHLEVQRRGKTICLEVFNVAYGRQWRHLVREELWPEFDLELDGASLPTTVAWREGTLDFNSWGANLDVSFLKGAAHIAGGTGRVNIQPVQANVAVHDHKGPVTLKGDSGQVTLSRDQGDLAVNWVSGKVAVEGGAGSLKLELGRGAAKILNFNGTVQGQGEQALWDLTAKAPADVNITTSTGPVGMHWQDGGAHVFLTSTHGSIAFPSSHFLKAVDDYEGRRVVEGVKTAKSMGQVFIRTDSGPISWR